MGPEGVPFHKPRIQHDRTGKRQVMKKERRKNLTEEKKEKIRGERESDIQIQ